jgi:hypothetical protein
VKNLRKTGIYILKKCIKYYQKPKTVLPNQFAWLMSCIDPESLCLICKLIENLMNARDNLLKGL